jgi:hypothetical protein
MGIRVEDCDSAYRNDGEMSLDRRIGANRGSARLPYELTGRLNFKRQSHSYSPARGTIQKERLGGSTRIGYEMTIASRGDFRIAPRENPIICP